MSDISAWIPLSIGDYIADTMHLTTEEHGAYFLLIMHYWRTGGAIPADAQTIKNVTKISQKKCEKVLRFFEKKDGFLFHKRIEQEIKNARERVEKQRKRTQAATQARRKSANVTTNVTETVTTNVTLSSVPLPPEYNNKHRDNNAARARADGKERGFDIDLVLDDNGRKRAKQSAPGWDLHYLMDVYNSGIRDGERPMPDKPSAAFPAWCKKYTKGKQP